MGKGQEIQKIGRVYLNILKIKMHNMTLDCKSVYIIIIPENPFWVKNQKNTTLINCKRVPYRDFLIFFKGEFIQSIKMSQRLNSIQSLLKKKSFFGQSQFCCCYIVILSQGDRPYIFFLFWAKFSLSLKNLFLFIYDLHYHNISSPFSI